MNLLRSLYTSLSRLTPEAKAAAQEAGVSLREYDSLLSDLNFILKATSGDDAKDDASDAPFAAAEALASALPTRTSSPESFSPRDCVPPPALQSRVWLDRRVSAAVYATVCAARRRTLLRETPVSLLKVKSFALCSAPQRLSR